jgi:hypothetical protein
MKPWIAVLALALSGCAGDGERLRSFSEEYNRTGLIGAIASSSPDAAAERRRKEQAKGALYAKLCTQIAPEGTPAHEGCIVQIREEQARKAAAVLAGSRSFTCHRHPDFSYCF